MNTLIKILGVLLLASGVAYFIVPMVRDTKAQQLEPAPAYQPPNPGGAGRAGTGAAGRTASGPLEAVCTVDSASRSVYSARTGGMVTDLNVREGQRVKAGDVLIRLDFRDLEFAKRAADAAVSDAEERERRTDFELRQAKDKLDNAVLAARDAEADANERLQQSELDQKHGDNKNQIALTDAQASVDLAVARLRRALFGLNRARGLAQLPAIPERGVEKAEIALPARPDPDKFDDTNIKYNDYIEQEMSFGEALVSARSALQALDKARIAGQQSTESLALAVTLGRSRAERARRDRELAEKAAAAYGETDRFTRAQAAGMVRSAKLEQERAEWSLSKATISASADDAGSIVAELNVQRGDIVSPGTRLAVLLDPARLRARSYIPVEHLAVFRKLKEAAGDGAMTVRVDTSAFDASVGALGLKDAPQFSGTVTRYVEQINPSTMAFPVELELDARPTNLGEDMAGAFSLQPGMVVRVTFGQAAAAPGNG